MVPYPQSRVVVKPDIGQTEGVGYGRYYAPPPRPGVLRAVIGRKFWKTSKKIGFMGPENVEVSHGGRIFRDIVSEP